MKIVSYNLEAMRYRLISHREKIYTSTILYYGSHL